MRERFTDEMTATIFEGTTLKGISLELAKQANRKGQHSIRVNDQWRICFVWRDGQADEIEWCDYHS